MQRNRAGKMPTWKCGCGLLTAVMALVLVPGPVGTRFLPQAAATGMLAQAPTVLSFTTVVDNLDLKKNTRFASREYLRQHYGDLVTGGGKVFEVIGGRGKVRILLANDSRTLVKGYNIDLTVYADLDKAAGLRKGQHIRFKGHLHRFKSGRYGGGIVYLNDCAVYLGKAG